MPTFQKQPGYLNLKKKDLFMLVQSKGSTRADHKDGLCIQQRRGGKETLVQWSNGDQRWIPTHDISGNVVLVGGSSEYVED